jgi:hypothetical protein
VLYISLDFGSGNIKHRQVILSPYYLSKNTDRLYMNPYYLSKAYITNIINEIHMTSLRIEIVI